MSDRLEQLGTFCTLSPVADEASLRAELASWSADASPFAALDFVHFARFVVITDLPRADAAQPSDPLPAPLLMFSCFFDGEGSVLLDALCGPLVDRADAVWRWCDGYPGHPRDRAYAFRSWLEAARVPATAIFAAYPHATVAEVRSALEFRERFRAFALDGTAARRRQAAFEAFLASPADA